MGVHACVLARARQRALSTLNAHTSVRAQYAGTGPWDKRWWPGVSVQISGQALRHLDIGAGEELVFDTQHIKGGKTLAFVETLVTDSKGVPYVRARQIKYQPLGAALALATLPIRFSKPLALLAFDRYLRSLPVHTLPDLPPGAEVFPIEGWHEDGDGGSGQVTVASPHGNPIGSMHGGAQVVALTDCCSVWGPSMRREGAQAKGVCEGAGLE